MGSYVRFSAAFVAVGLAAALAFGGDGHDGLLPKTAIEAREWATPLIDAARPAKSAETPEIAKGIRRAIDWMLPYRTAGSGSPEWSAAWNEALTLSRFHKNKPTGDYILESKHVDMNYLYFGIVAGRGWTAVTPELGHSNTGTICEITDSLPDGRYTASIKISMFTFACIYFDTVDGSNATALAKRQIDCMRGMLQKVDSASANVVAKPLSKGFPRAQYVEATGSSDTLGKMRLRTYYAKGAYRTYEFLVSEYCDVKEGEAPIDAWFKGVENPELEAVLDSFEEGRLKKVR